MTHLLQVSSLTCTYPGAGRVLGPIDFTVTHGELLVVVGPSGGGKSTLLRCLAGLERPSGGSIDWRGAPGDWRGAPGLIGVVFQEPRLMPWLDVARNVGFGLRLTGAARRARIHELLDLVGLADAAARLPKQLSGGMAQRVALARGLASHPALLLLDEPFSALDAPTRARLQDHLRSLQTRTGTTMVLVTHDLVEALRLGDRILVLGDRPGRIVAEMKPALGAMPDPAGAAFRSAQVRLAAWLQDPARGPGASDLNSSNPARNECGAG